jgi:hypothetical protein
MHAHSDMYSVRSTDYFGKGCHTHKLYIYLYTIPYPVSVSAGTGHTILLAVTACEGLVPEE